MCCNKKCGKVILVILNILFVLLGAACLVAGILILVDKTVLSSALSKIPNANETLDQALQAHSMLQRSAYVIIGVGAVVFVIGFSGCFGALKEVKCLLIIYAIIVVIILAAQIAGAVLGFMYKERVISYMQNFLNKTISEKYEGLQLSNGALTKSLEPYTAAWDIAMITLQCCGNHNYTDFENYATNWNKTYTYSGHEITAKVPISCCKTTDKAALLADLTNAAKYFTNSTLCIMNADPMYTNTVNCYDQIVSYTNMYTAALIGICIGIALIELLAIISACAVLKAIKEDNEFV